MFHSVVYLLNTRVLKCNKSHRESFSLQPLYTWHFPPVISVYLNTFGILVCFERIRGG